MIEEVLESRDDSTPDESLSRRIEAASLLASRGGIHGTDLPNWQEKFSEERKPVMEAHIQALRERGIEIDPGVAWRPPQPSSGISQLIAGSWSIVTGRMTGSQ